LDWRCAVSVVVAPSASASTKTSAHPIKELLKPRTWSDVWDMHINERIEDGAEINEPFDLNSPENRTK
jgi:hypothetical protein